MAALRAPGGRLLGAEAQAMSVHIVEPTQRRPRPTYAACGGNGGWARRPPGLAAAAPQARYRGPGSAATRRAHGFCGRLRRPRLAHHGAPERHSETGTLCVLASLPQPDLELRSLRNAARQYPCA